MTVRLETERLVLRPWRRGDEEAIVRHADNRRVWLNLRDLFPHGDLAPCSMTHYTRMGYTVYGRERRGERWIAPRVGEKGSVRFVVGA